MSESMKRRVAYVSEFSFGDFMTRTGLDEAERELIVMSVIASLGGADSQLSGIQQEVWWQEIREMNCWQPYF